MSYWQKKIDEARKRGHFTESSVDEAYDWVTCACGRQDPRMPRRVSGAPKDEVLLQWGGEFAYAVRAHRFDRAEFYLQKIEKRAAEVLAEVTK